MPVFSRGEVSIHYEEYGAGYPVLLFAPGLVGGFQVPEKLRYHPGHTWALSESPSLVRVGLDEFAAKLTGKLERIALPQRGQWIRQGQKIWTLHRDGSTVDMLSYRRQRGRHQ